jgi:hypothetical protein
MTLYFILRHCILLCNTWLCTLSYFVTHDFVLYCMILYFTLWDTWLCTLFYDTVSYFVTHDFVLYFMMLYLTLWHMSLYFFYDIVSYFVTHDFIQYYTLFWELDCICIASNIINPSCMLGLIKGFRVVDGGGPSNPGK